MKKFSRAVTRSPSCSAATARASRRRAAASKVGPKSASFCMRARMPATSAAASGPMMVTRCDSRPWSHSGPLARMTLSISQRCSSNRRQTGSCSAEIVPCRLIVAHAGTGTPNILAALSPMILSLSASEMPGVSRTNSTGFRSPTG